MKACGFRSDRNSLADCVRFLNPVLRGWGQYFRVGNSNRQFHLLDRYVTFRLARFDQDKRQRSSPAS